MSSSVSLREIFQLQSGNSVARAQPERDPLGAFHFVREIFARLRVVIRRKAPDQCKRDNRRHFASVASQWSRPRSVRFPDNLCRASRRDYELIRNQDAHNSRFRNVGNRHLPGSPIVISKNSASASESCRNSPRAWRRKNSVSSSYVRQYVEMCSGSSAIVFSRVARH